MSRFSSLMVWTLLGALVMAPAAMAQAPIKPGQVRVQGKPLAAPAEAPVPVPAGLQIDLRQQLEET